MPDAPPRLSPADEIDDHGQSVAVVIPAFTLDRWALLEKAVESARNQSAPVSEVVVCIDNNHDLFEVARARWRNSDGTPVRVLANSRSDHLGRVDVHVRAHGTTRRFGAGSARNTAADTVTADIIAFMDDDAYAEPTWIERLLSVYGAHDPVAVGGAPLADYETGRPSWFPDGFEWVYGCAYDGLPTDVGPLRHLIGSNMSVSRDAFVAIGGFQGSDFDDLNLCMRLAERFGVERLYYTPDAIVHHFVPESRVTWRYFWRRCYYVNKEKVRVFTNMGSAANLIAEREFVIRRLRKDLLGAVTDLGAGRWSSLRPRCATFVGIALAAAGHGVGRVSRFSRRGREASRAVRLSGADDTRESRMVQITHPTSNLDDQNGDRRPADAMRNEAEI